MENFCFIGSDEDLKRNSFKKCSLFDGWFREKYGKSVYILNKDKLICYRFSQWSYGNLKIKLKFVRNEKFIKDLIKQNLVKKVKHERNID